MKLALFDDYRPGLIVGERIIDISGPVGPEIMAQLPRDRMAEIVSRFPFLKERIADLSSNVGQPLNSVKLRAPLPRPDTMLFGLGNYREFLQTPPKPFNMFVKSSRSVLDPGEVVELIRAEPFVFHHEAELAIIIGKPGRDIAPADAMDHVFGYTNVVDVSARGFRSNVSFINKSPDGFCPMGPAILTSDEIADPQNLQVRLWVNGQLRQDYPTSDMEHGVREIVAYASRVLPLVPGDLLACGVNHQGLGPLQDGDHCEMEIEPIGKLGFFVADPLKRRWPHSIDSGMADAARRYRRGEPLPPPTEMFLQRI